VVGGKNGVGKSSTLDAIEAAFGGGNASNQVFVDVTYLIRRTGL